MDTSQDNHPVLLWSVFFGMVLWAWIEDGFGVAFGFMLWALSIILLVQTAFLVFGGKHSV